MKIENTDTRDAMSAIPLSADGSIRSPKSLTKYNDDETKIIKALQVQSAGYDRPLPGASSSGASSLFSADSGLAEMDPKAAMQKITKLLGAKDYDELRSNDFSPEAMEERRITTVVEKMQIEMAKAGVDISKLASDLDAADIEAITGGALTASSIETAMKKAQEIASAGGELTQGETDYLLSGELEPTIDNIYAAKFSGADAGMTPRDGGNSGMARRDSGNAPAAPAPSADPAGAAEFEKIRGDAEKIIAEAGLEVSKETLEEARYLFENGLPVTGENLKLLDTISNNDLISDENAVISAIIDGAAEGREAGEAYLLPGYSAMDRARDFKDFVDNADPKEIAARDDIDDVTARRVLEETRLVMTVEANFALMKQGIAIDTQPLVQVVEELKAKEQEYYAAVFGIDSSGGDEAAAAVTPEEIASYNETNEALDTLRRAPAYTLGVVEIKTSTLEETKNVGWDLMDRLERAGETYEALGTSPRADLGDSMKKAFGNVGDMLSSLGMEDTNENQRAVRILAYNRMEINQESILTVREKDETVQAAFGALTPGVVARMVKSGVNPLDMTMPELAKKAEEIKTTYNIDNDNDRFSRFLVKLEQNSEITDEERSAYIGIYRLISRVEAADGAAIGSLLGQGREITMRNLMTAVRTGKKLSRGVDETIDKTTGFAEVRREEPSITQQIEANIAIAQLAQAKELATPALLRAASEGDVDNLMDKTPGQLLAGLEENAENEQAAAESKAYADGQIDELRQASDSSQEIYDLLKNLQVPVTAENLQAAALYMTGKNRMFTQLMDRAEDMEDEPDIHGLIEKCMLRLGEDVKTPQEMADAQEALAELAEHAMDGYITEEEVAAVDLKGMKLTRTVAHFMKQMAKNDSYTLPIKVNDATGNVSIKIVHGEKEEGLIDLTFFCEELGDVEGRLHYTPDLVEWSLEARDEEAMNRIRQNAKELDDILAKETEGRRGGSEVTDNDLSRAAGRVLEFLKNLAETA